MTTFNWTDGSAIWQVQYGTPGTPKTVSAFEYLKSRIYSEEDANKLSRIAAGLLETLATERGE